MYTLMPIGLAVWWIVKAHRDVASHLDLLLISWMSRKQKSVALSTAEAEYIAASMACCEAVWLRKLFSELFEHVLDATIILCDNQRGIRLS